MNSIAQDHETTERVIAAVDLGSNSFHMIVAQLKDGHLRTIDRLREPVRLAEGLGTDNTLSKKKRGSALACLERFGQRLADLGSRDVRAVGTNTLRAAHNADEFLAEGELALGHPIDIISGIEEARLVYKGVAHSVASTTGQQLVVDIGGGSTEFIIGNGPETTLLESLYMGCVTMTQRYFEKGAISKRAMKKAETAAAQELQAIEKRYRAAGWSMACGASGTIRAIGRAAHALELCEDGLLSRKAVATIKDQIVDAGSIKKIDLKGINETRTQVIPGGIAILSATMNTLGIKQLQISDGALREGLLYDLAGRILHEDIRDRTVSGLAVRWGIDETHAARVRTTAMSLYEQIKKESAMESPDTAAMLSWAATLHEAGLLVAHDHYHRHGAYIIGNGNLPGFTRQEQQVLATLVRAHRRRFPADEFSPLPKRWRKNAPQLAIILRLATMLHRGRSGQELPEVKLSLKKNAFKLEIPDDWLREHPLTSADLAHEAQHLETSEWTLAFSGY